VNTTELWFLDIAYKVCIPIEWLVTRDDLPEMFNIPRAELSRDEILSILMQLIDQELIEVYTMKDIYEPVGDAWIPSRIDIEHCFNGTLPLCYTLTSRGGAQWEMGVKPDWNRYVNDEYYDDQGHGFIESRSKAFITLLSTLIRMDRGLSVIPGTEEWTQVAPWIPVPWKTLDYGWIYRFRYTCVANTDEELSSLVNECLKVLYQWRHFPLH
jgi:hypothetical protein